MTWVCRFVGLCDVEENSQFFHESIMSLMMDEHCSENPDNSNIYMFVIVKCNCL